MTLNNIEALFKDLANRHKQVNSFYNQETFDIAAVEEVTYPSLVINTNEIKLPKGAGGYSLKRFSLELQIIDLVHKDDSNKQEVLSDTDSILNDIVNEFSTHEVYHNLGIDLIEDTTLSPLRDAYGDAISGWNTTLTFDTPLKISWCGSPLLTLSGEPNTIGSVTVIDALNQDSPIKLYNGDNYTCTPFSGLTVSNSSDSYSVLAQSSLELPDINFTDSDGTTTSIPSVENIVATPCEVKSGIKYARPQVTGQKTSYRTGDDKWRLDNMPYNAAPTNPLYCQELIDFYTLKHDNAFGNRLRFTDIGGNFTVISDNSQVPNSTYRYIIDHYTGLGVAFTSTYLPNSFNWDTAIDDSLSLNVYGFDDYYLPNLNELSSLLDYEGNLYNINIPFAVGARIQWVSTTKEVNTSQAHYVNTSGLSSSTAKTGALNYIAIRIHY